MKRIDNIMQYFKYDHLPKELQEVSKPCGDLAKEIDEYMNIHIFSVNEDEWYEGMRKLLEAKDCFVRAKV